MKRIVQLCPGCIKDLDDYFPYTYPDGTPMKKEDLIIEPVNDQVDCDNDVSNLVGREPVWIEDAPAGMDTDGDRLKDGRHFLIYNGICYSI
jgi:hypothetical protein